MIRSSPHRGDPGIPTPRMENGARRPLDETMLVRLVLASGMIRGPDLIRFYLREGSRPGGGRPIDRMLIERGMDPVRIQSLKRAYVETRPFGEALVAELCRGRAGTARALRIERELAACEREQLLRIRRGEPPAPIGQMLLRRGLISPWELCQALDRQGLLSRAERYAAGGRSDVPPAVRPWFRRLASAPRVALAVGAALLLAAVLADLWLTGIFRRPADHFEAARGEAEHADNVTAIYEGLLDDLRLGQLGSAEHCRRLLHEYFRRLAGRGIDLPDPRARHIREVYARLDFARLKSADPESLPRMSNEELETALVAPQ